jgi:hypothetical protein
MILLLTWSGVPLFRVLILVVPVDRSAGFLVLVGLDPAVLAADHRPDRPRIVQDAI